jgi:hypothetical protein
MGAVAVYRGLYLEALRRRHRIRPIVPAARLWTNAEIAG